MKEAYLKVGTWPGGFYDVWGNKPIEQYGFGDRIKFRSRSKHDGDLCRWTTGRITRVGHVILVERL